MSPDRVGRIRALNDSFRKSFIGGKVFITEGVRALGPDFESACVERVQKHRRFAEGNDPYGEHDFGAFMGKGYSTDTAEGMHLWQAVSERLALMPAAPQPVTAERYGQPVLVRQRLGQGAFRISVTDGYGRRCAVSGEKTLPILDAAHIRAFGEGGEHAFSNGLLLRTDIHRLFDLGYVTVTERNQFAVSERLKADFDNGVHYYAMQGTDLAMPRPGFAPPSPEALRWHQENRYLG